MDNRIFLGVKQSARGMAWRDRLNLLEDNCAMAIAQNLNVSPLCARVLAGRGVDETQADAFLNPTIRDLLPDPASLTDMEKAAQRIGEAIQKRERVAIFGDYDVDGACSSALMSRFLTHFDIEHEIHIPDRIFEGYGPNPQAMQDLAGRGASLIITVDCGVSSFEAIAAAKQARSDVVVLDHHQTGPLLPPEASAIVNPNRQDDLSDQGHLCAGGVVFLTLVQIAKYLRECGHEKNPPDLLSYLDLVALSTVCDVVPLIGVNRAFVVKGLQVARSMSNCGMRALSDVARIGEPLNPYHFGFILGPRINAGGRIGDAALGARLLTCENEAEALDISGRLDVLNQERQAMEREMLEDAKGQAEADMSDGVGPAVLVTQSDDWHPGVVGLLAARLKEHARRPAFAISFNRDGVGAGSGRSIPGFDLGAMVRKGVENGLLVKGGGHAMAAGITVEREKLGALRAFFEEEAGLSVAQLRQGESLKIDGALSADGATFELIDELERAGPFGSGHPTPIVALPRHRLADVRAMGATGAHLRVSLQSQTGKRLNGVAFGVGDTPLGEFLIKNRGEMVHVAGILAVNFWQGKRSIQLRILDAASIQQL